MKPNRILLADADDNVRETAASFLRQAEGATGVLHNVGNVLNSVNVSATLVGEQLTRSWVPALLWKNFQSD